MKGINRKTLFEWSIAAAAAIPALLFAYLGHFSRMIADEYCRVAISRAHELWDALSYYLTTWTSAYTKSFLELILASLEPSLASIMPIAIILLWCAALLWALWLVSWQLLNRPASLPLLIALVFLIVSASINGMLSQQSFYWSLASLAYTLPISVILLCLGIWIWAGFAQVSSGRVMLAAAAVFALCFFNAGLAEMLLVFQGVFLTGMIAAAGFFLGASRRRRSIVLLGAGWIATAISGAIQLSSAGIYARMTDDVSRVMNRAEPVRTLPELIIKSAEATFELIGYQQAFAGFVIVFAAALFATLSAGQRGPQSESASESTLVAPALWLGSTTQLLFVPILWMHTSDTPQVLGRFSIAYFIVVCVNGLQIAAFALLLASRRRNEERLRLRANRQIYFAAILLAALALFAMTQFRSIHFRAATYLFVSSFVLLCVAWLRLRPGGTDAGNTRTVWLPLFASGLALICYVGLIVVSLYGQGFIVKRVFVPATFVHIVSGALWGAGLGWRIRRDALSGPSNGRRLNAFRAASLAVALVIGIGIVIGQLRMAPRLATFAREWDDRHAEIIRQRESGSSTIVVPELSYDFGYDLVRWNIYDTQGVARCSAKYYGVESIVRTEDGA